MEESKMIEQSSPFKFKELKVYSSTEWLSGNRKRYRQVFDAFETGYVYAELSFINKFFDEIFCIDPNDPVTGIVVLRTEEKQ